MKCKICRTEILEENIKKKKNNGGFLAICSNEDCGMVNNIKCRHNGGEQRKVTAFHDRRFQSRQEILAV